MVSVEDGKNCGVVNLVVSRVIIQGADDIGEADGAATGDQVGTGDCCIGSDYGDDSDVNGVDDEWQ